MNGEEKKIDPNGEELESSEPVEVVASQEEVNSAKLQDVAGVLFVDGKVLEFEVQGESIAVGDQVVVDNERDLNLGKVVYLQERAEHRPLHRIIRRVSSEDFLLIRRNQKREQEAFDLCQKMIMQHRLPMKLIRVAYLHGGNKAIFYFSAEGRVDFRALVRDLAQQLHVRIEMRQIGVRDESKILGGLGICGQHLCCSRFLQKFSPVSIKMAKNQNLALNPQKLSGLCGRLMCCLVYEDDVYKMYRKDLPKIGSVIDTPQGAGKVIDLDVLNKRILVQLENSTAVFYPAELRGEYVEINKEPLDESRENRLGEAKKPIRDRMINPSTKSNAEPDATTDKAKESQRPLRTNEPNQEGSENPNKKRRKRRSRRRSRRKKNKTATNQENVAGSSTRNNPSGNSP